MKKLFTTTLLLLCGICGFQSLAQNNDDLDAEAVIRQVAPLRWNVVWEDYTFVNPGYCIYDETDPEFRAFLVNSDDEQIPLYYQQQIEFPLYGNYFTVILEGMDLPDGNYELNIPEYYVDMVPGRVPNVHQYLPIEIGGNQDIPFEVNIKPLEGNYFDISWSGVTSLQEADTTGAYMINQETDARFDLYYLEDFMFSEANLRIEGNILRVNITNRYPDLPGGVYKFYLPEGYVYFNGTDVTNQAIDGYEFTYDAPFDEGPVECNGPDDAGLITVTWTSATALSFNEDWKDDGYIFGPTLFYGNEGNMSTIPASKLSISGTTLIVDISYLANLKGSCRLLIPDSYLCVTNGGVSDFSYEVYYDFVCNEGGEDPDQPGESLPLYPGMAEWNIESGASLKPDDYPVVVNWDRQQLTLAPDAEPVNLYSSMVGYVELEYGTDVFISDDGTELWINLITLTDEVYRLNVPESCVIIDVDGTKYHNMATSLDNLIVTNDDPGSVESLRDGSGLFRVFNLKGVKVLETENTSELKNLPGGLYIINGKKVLK